VTPPAIAVSAAEARFQAPIDEPDPPEQALQVTDAGGGRLEGLALAVEYGAGQPQGWLTAALSAGSAPAR
jgi:hypothetical protein